MPNDQKECLDDPPNSSLYTNTKAKSRAIGFFFSYYLNCVKLNLLNGNKDFDKNKTHGKCFSNNV